MRLRFLPLFLLIAGCKGHLSIDTGAGDTGHTGTTDTGHTGDTGTADTGTTDTGSTDTGTTDTGTMDTGPLPGNWDFEDWSTSNPPPGFTRDPADASWSVAQSTEPVQGTSAATLSLASSAGDRALRSADVVDVQAGTTYVFHAWVNDGDANVDARLELQPYAGSTASDPVDGLTQITSTAGWRELTLSWTDPETGSSDTLRPSLILVEAGGGTAAGASLQTDAWAITGPASIDVTDEQVDADTVLVAGTPGQTMDARAAVDDAGMLYASTNWADQGSDHLLFVWIGPPDPTATVAPPWSKSGLVAAPGSGGWLLVLAQEESNKYCEWDLYDTGSSAWVSEADNSTCTSTGTGPRLEGSLDLVGALGLGGATDLPATLAFSVGPWGTNNGDALKADYQEPPGNGDTTIDAGETASFPRADLLAGRLVPRPP